MRILLDTNVIVSSFTTRGLCADIFSEILTRHTLIVSDQISKETNEVLLNRFGIPSDTVKEILLLLNKQEAATLPDPLPIIEIRDQSDYAIVAAAIGSNVDYLITGDKDILSISLPNRHPKIVSPREFWNIIVSS